MFSVFIKHMVQSGKFLATRCMGATNGTIKPCIRHSDMPVQYSVHEENGGSPYSVDALFPSGKI